MGGKDDYCAKCGARLDECTCDARRQLDEALEEALGRGRQPTPADDLRERTTVLALRLRAAVRTHAEHAPQCPQCATCSGLFGDLVTAQRACEDINRRQPRRARADIASPVLRRASLNSYQQGPSPRIRVVMRNTLRTSRALARCPHNASVESIHVSGIPVLRCNTCGARSLPSGANGSEPATAVRPGQTVWRRPDLVERLERDYSEELPIVGMELEEAEACCGDIIESLENLQSLARGPNFVVEPGVLTAVVDALRIWRSGIGNLRERFDDGRSRE